MHLPRTQAVAPNFDFLTEIGSTNVELAARASAAEQPDFTVLATTNQTAGKGRLGREWVAPAGTTIAVSVLLKPGPAPQDALGWLPLLAGLAMTRTVDALVTDHAVSLKWPNDVHIDGLKVAGILAELVPAGAVVLGAGLNLTMTAEELPTPVATSLTLNGAPADQLVDVALATYLSNLSDLYGRFTAAGLDATGSGLAVEITRACGTIGRNVKVELPDGSTLFGVAEGMDGAGRLMVRSMADDRLAPVAAGDVTHLRYE
ncbi:MAG: biotin--[acetyl-CoA-carboxylase] ligase [Salinibacterium sp.]|nr:MAG: biotin--[acetyl-CoA-carboxylase] ligase [Salinibacterium sp.]